MTKVINISTGGKFDIYIGRKLHQPHHYGNPFRIGDDGDRDTVIIKCLLWLAGLAYEDIEPDRWQWVIDTMDSLKDKILGCHCKPLACHGDIYKELLDSITLSSLQ